MFRRNAEERAAAEAEKIKKYEAHAERDPKGYARKVIAAAVAGYAAPIVFLLLMLGVIAAGVLHVANGGSGAAGIVKLAFIVAVLAIMVGKSLIVKFDPPEARQITKNEAPKLFDVIDAIRKTLKGPAIHEVYLDDRLNAAIEQAPRFGLFGGHINRLIIGLPLMQALSVEECRAVIGHEYGHLAGSHGKTGAWIYRMRAMWRRLYEEIDNYETWLYLPLKFFIHRYAPWFERLSFPLARANEYEADRAGAAVSDSQTAADALMRVTLAARYLDDAFWPKVWRQTRKAPAPNVAPYTMIGKSFAAMPQWPQKTAWAKEELRRKTDFVDTNPALADRIKALGAKARLPQPARSSAVELLGDFYVTMRKKFDAQWKEQAAPAWNASYEEIKLRRMRLAALDEKARTAGRLASAEALERARLADAVLEPDEALARFKQAAGWDPKNAPAWLELGRLLAERQDERALQCVKRAGDIDAKLKLDAAAVACRLHNAKGNGEAADAAADTWRTEQARHEAALREIFELDKKAELFAHDLDEDELAAIIEAVSCIDGVREAYLLRKPSELFDKFEGYHLVITPKSEKAFDYSRAAAHLQNLSFDGHLYFWFAVQNNRWMRKRGAKIEGASLETTPAMKSAA